VGACVLWTFNSPKPLAAFYIMTMLEILDPARAAFEAVGGYAE
jgi:hypothetical protein